MKQAFLDTSGWLAALNSKEAHHRLAMTTSRGWTEEGRQLVTTNLVLSEMQILLMRFRGVSAGVQFLDSVHQDPGHDVIYVDRDLERAAVARWLHRFSDQQISLADAVSFEVMRQPRIRSVLALDEHFTTAGFDAVP